MRDARATQDLVDAFVGRQLSRRQFVQRALSLGLSATSAGALLAGCNSGSSSTPQARASSSSSPSSSTKSLTGNVQILVGFGTGNSPEQAQVQTALAEAFMREQPGVKIDFLRVPGSSDARTKLTVLIAGGQPPDLVMPAGLYGISLFVDQNIWLDLGPMLDRDGLTLQNFIPETVAATRVPNFYGKNSTSVIGIPVGVNDHALVYNTALLEKAGIAAPPTSWSDDSWQLTGSFLDTAKALTRDNKGRSSGEAGFDRDNIATYGLGHYFRESIFYAFGGHLYDPSSRKAQFDTPESIAGIAFAADLVNRYSVQPSQTQVAALGAGGGTGNEEQFAWRSGKLAMIDMCTCDIRSPFGTDVPFTYKAAALPAGPSRRFGFLNLDVGAIVQASKNQDLAWEVLKYFTYDPAVERKLSFGSYGAIPPLQQNKDAFATGINKELPEVTPEVWLEGLPSSSPENESWFPAFAEVNDLVGKTFDDIVGGKSTAAQAMPTLQKSAQGKIDEWFQTHKLPSD